MASKLTTVNRCLHDFLLLFNFVIFVYFMITKLLLQTMKLRQIKNLVYRKRMQYGHYILLLLVTFTFECKSELDFSYYHSY